MFGSSSNGDYRRKYLIMAVIIVAFIVYSLVRAGHYVTLSSPSDNEIRVEAKDAAEGGSAVGYLELGDGQGMAITADLSENSIFVEVFVEDENGEAQEVFDETFAGNDSSSYELSPGRYAVRVTAHEHATGTMTVVVTE